MEANARTKFASAARQSSFFFFFFFLAIKGRLKCHNLDSL